MKLRKLLLSACFLTAMAQAQTLPVMETGGQVMPDEWIDKDTGHKVMRLHPKGWTESKFLFPQQPLCRR